jgi:hypothetical protein
LPIDRFFSQNHLGTLNPICTLTFAERNIAKHAESQSKQVVLKCNDLLSFIHLNQHGANPTTPAFTTTKLAL